MTRAPELTDRLVALGQLTAGLAHEINTPVQFISDNLQFLRDTVVTLVAALPSDRRGEHEPLIADADAALDACRDGVARIRDLVTAVHQLGHPGRDRRELVNLGEVVTRAVAMSAAEVRRVASATVEVAAPAPVAWGCPGELEQVVVNLVVNAAHAVGDRVAAGGQRGAIAVRTWVDRGAVLVEVADDGPGVPAALRERVFEPFFTTKPVGRGLGLGLALARSIVVDRHGGELRYDDRPGGGAAFTIALPRATDQA